MSIQTWDFCLWDKPIHSWIPTDQGQKLSIDILKSPPGQHRSCIFSYLYLHCSSDASSPSSTLSSPEAIVLAFGESTTGVVFFRRKTAILLRMGVISSRESFGFGVQMLLFHSLPFLVRLQGSLHLAFCSCGETCAL